ncbi:MAG: tripartite tricarboxylate transporter TctB family protein [Burkholderiaceae bacterium]
MARIARRIGETALRLDGDALNNKYSQETSLRIRNQKDFWSGVMFFAFGLFFAGFAQEYDMGSAARMGPAFFPTMLGGMLLLLGVIIGIQGLTIEEAEGKIDRFYFRPLLLVLGSVVAFGLLLRPAGLIVSLFVLVIISSFGGHEFKWRDVLLLALGLMLLMLAVFVYGLGMTIPVLPEFMRE